MPRRSTRLNVPSIVPESQLVTIGVNGADDEDEFVMAPKQPRQKRRKTSQINEKPKRTRGRRGILKQLTDVPLDVLFEIFGHLNPLDILHLARTTKALRGILMRRSAISIWKQARCNVKNLPPCPTDLTEPQYVNLAFDTHCHYCLAPHVPTIIWAARARCCKKCIPENFLTAYDLKERHCIVLHVRDFYIIPSFEGPPPDHHNHWARRPILYSVAFAKRFSDEYKEIKDTGEKAVQWFTAKSEEQRVQLAHTTLCEMWNSSRVINRSREIEDARKRRCTAIVEKLTELGWGEEIEKMRWSEFANHTFVKQPKDLTARIWTNIRPALVAFMEKNKTLRLKEERLIILAKRHRLLVYLRKDYDSTRPVYEITPGVADIAGMEPFRTIIEDSSVDDEVGADSFAQAMTELPRLAQEWKKSKDEELLEIISKDSTFFSDPTSTDLTLATTFFKCPVCQEPLSYPRVLAHSHLTLPLPYHPWKNEESEQTALFAKLSETPWNFGGRLSFFNDAYMAARGVVKACGLDPGAATASEMDELDPFVECLLCKNTGRQIMRWKRAIVHDIFDHRSISSVSWVPLPEADRTLAEAVEARRAALQTMFPVKDDFCCIRCKHRTNQFSMRTHITTVHAIHPEDVTKEDYMVYLDASINIIPTPITLPSVPATSAP